MMYVTRVASAEELSVVGEKTQSNEDRDKFIVQNTKVTELIKNVKTS